MPSLSRQLLKLAALFVVAACGSSSNNPPAPPALTVTVTVDSGAVDTVTNGVKADGTNSLTIAVGGSTKGPIRLTAHKGTFLGGATTATIDGTSGSVTLFTCDARVDNGCAGGTTVSATDANFAFGSANVGFVGFETSCANRIDDNRDNRTDCADPDCNDAACVDSSGGTGTCQSGACTPPVCTPTAETEACDNNADDDCDGKIDCQQDSCDSQPCKPGFPTFVCKSRACTDIGSGYAIAVTAKRTRLPADGQATTTVTAKLTKMNLPQAGVQLDFNTNFGQFVVGQTTTTSTTLGTGADGTATVTFQASDVAAGARITVSLHELAQVSQSVTITMPALGSITVAKVQNQVMGVKFSGFNEQNAISVLLLDTEQRPYPDGLAVRFEHQQLSGSTISIPFTADTGSCVQANGCLGYIGRTTSPLDKPDTGGLASVNLYSGTAAGPVSVSVTATAGEVTRNFTVSNIAVVGAKASGAHVSLFCTPLNVPGFVNNNCTNSFYNGPGDTISCTVFLADRFGNVLGRETRADFRSEAGAPGPPVLTKAYDPVRGGDQTADLGHATDSVLVTGYPLPADVDPIEGEFSNLYDAGCGASTHNPRDGIVTVIVAVQGEEGFVDLNGNGVYDSGEPFVDAGEPFIDYNDNNIHDADEPFIDVNMNHQWDGPNGKWDADTVVWGEARVLYTGPAQTPLSRWVDTHDLGLLPDVTPGVVFQVSSKTTPPTSQGFSVYFSDANFNPLAATSSYSIGPLVGHVSAAYTSTPRKVDTLGLTFQQQFCDKAPPQAPSACFMSCKSAPCYRVTKVSGFQYGTVGAAAITGVSTGPDTVHATASVGGITTQILITGSSD